MAEINTKAFLVLLARLIISAVFLLAALPKIQDPAAFAASVEGYRVIGGAAALWVALILPWLELVLGFGLLVPQIRRGSGVLILLLLLVFIGLHASAWVRGLDISCGCFGAHDATSPPNYLWVILRNTALFAAGAGVLLRDCWNPRLRAVSKVASAS